MFEIALKLERNFVLGRSAEGLPVSFASLYRYNMHQLRKGVNFFQSKCLLEVPSSLKVGLFMVITQDMSLNGPIITFER